MTANVVVMGVAGSGKSTFGRALADFLGREFVEGDDFHPAENIQKMAAGEALTDSDREPWLQRLGERLAEADQDGVPVVLACSCLKRRYRDTLRGLSPALAMVHIEVDAGLIGQRLSRRSRHFFPVSLIDSQFAALERLGAMEHGLTLSGALPIATLINVSRHWLSSGKSPRTPTPR